MTSPSLTFEPIDPVAFPLFGIGTEAGRRGGMAPTVFNAANEVAVAAFLADEVSFPMIADIVEATLAKADAGPAAELEDVLAADLRARSLAREQVDRGQTAVRGYVP
jgi:1-deoxy-D-xylulose-5-phosphate reductoisomerase